jgi:hypothetical protein
MLSAKGGKSTWTSLTGLEPLADDDAGFRAEKFALAKRANKMAVANWIKS